MYVINSQNEKEPFSRKKVYRGLLKAGADKTLAKEITEKIEKEAYDGISTLELSQKIKKYLQERSFKTLVRFSLKEGMLKLGPTGFLFEKYIKEIFSSLGYETKINLHLKGISQVEYEIDVFIKKENEAYLCECKYHQQRELRVDLKIALANYARFLDLKETPVFRKVKKFLRPMLITNTKFTSQVIRFSEFYNISLLGWKYPLKRGLEVLIEENNLYPITILPSFFIDHQLKEAFVNEKIMLVKDLFKEETKEMIRKYNLSPSSYERIVNEAKTLLSS